MASGSAASGAGSDGECDAGGRVGRDELEVRLSGASAQTVTVDYETEDDSAIAGEDYTETSGTLTFGPGATARTIVVIDDAEDEQEETFEVTLSGPWNATLSGGQAELRGTATIADDTRGTVNELGVERLER